MGELTDLMLQSAIWEARNGDRCVVFMLDYGHAQAAARRCRGLGKDVELVREDLVQVGPSYITFAGVRHWPSFGLGYQRFLDRAAFDHLRQRAN